MVTLEVAMIFVCTTCNYHMVHLSSCVDGMVIAVKSMLEIKILKSQLGDEFEIMIWML
jgi:hypothetical protein